MPNLNQTLERLFSPGNGLIINPGFHRFYSTGPASGAFTGFSRPALGPGKGGIVSGPWQGGHLPAGWLPFGAASLGLVLQPSSFGADSSTFHSLFGSIPSEFNEDNPIYLSDRDQYPGLGVTVVTNRVGGIMQRLPNGRALRGKKLRIYGAYQVTVPDIRPSGSPADLGISVWLKGRVHQVTARGDVYRSTGGEPGTASKGGTDMSTPSDPFTNVQAGDTLWLQEGSSVYVVDSVFASNVAIEGVFVQDHTAVNWSVGRRQPNGVNVDANWHSGRGVHIRAAVNGIPGAVLRMADPNVDFNRGMEWYVPGLDTLVYPSDGSGLLAFDVDGATNAGGTLFNSVGTYAPKDFLTSIPNSLGTPDLSTYLLIPGEAAIPVTNVNSDTQLALGAPLPTGSLTGQNYMVVALPVVDDSNVPACVLMHGASISNDEEFVSFWPGASPPALNGGAAPAADQCRIWYLDSDDWTDVAANGNAFLFEDLTTNTGVQYFEQIVEVPADMQLDEDELYLVAMPINPNNAGDIHNLASVFYYYLQVEVVAENASDGNGVQDRIIRAESHGDPYGLSMAKGNNTLFAREPIWVPLEFELNLADVKPSDMDFSKINVFDLRPQGGVGYLEIGDGTVQSLASRYWFPFPNLPVGTVLEFVRIDVDNGGNLHSNDIEYRLYQFFSQEPAYSTGFTRAPISGVAIDTSTLSTVTFSMDRETNNTAGNIYRHMLGWPWPTSDADLPAVLGGLGHHYQPARFYLAVSPQGSDDWEIRIKGIWCKAWVDARALRGMRGRLNPAVL